MAGELRHQPDPGGYKLRERSRLNNRELAAYKQMLVVEE